MDPRFHTTHWSLVLAARTTRSQRSDEALSSLCKTYWFPLYSFVRRQGHDAEEARDLTQAYFARLLEKKYLQDVDPAAGRFRSFLLVSLKHFLSNERDRVRALKRGGAVAHVSLDADAAESRYRIEPVEQSTPEQLYERHWAMTVLERVQERLRQEAETGGRQRLYEALQGHLTSGEERAPYSAIAGELEMTEPAVKQAVYRMRRRYGQLLREEIAQTVADPAQVDDEIRHLLTALRN